MVIHCVILLRSAASSSVMPPLVDSTEVITQPPPISPDNGVVMRSYHINDAIDTDVTQSALDVLTNNPSTPRVNGPQKFVPVNTNVKGGNIH